MLFLTLASHIHTSIISREWWKNCTSSIFIHLWDSVLVYIFSIYMLFLECLNGKVNARLLEKWPYVLSIIFFKFSITESCFFRTDSTTSIYLRICLLHFWKRRREWIFCCIFIIYAAIWVKTRYPNSYLLLKKQLQGIFFMNLIHFIEIWNQGRIVLILVGFLLKWKLRTSLLQH